MSSKGYAFAVANVRAAENELLTRSFFDQLVNAASAAEMKRMLSDKGINVPDADFMKNVWDYISEIAPQPEELEFLIVRNDFHNLKSVLKGTAADTDGRRFCIKPSIIDTDVLYDAVKNKNFDILPEWISGAAAEGYELLTSVMDGRMLDMFLDRKSVEATVAFAEKTENSFFRDYAEKFAALTNIKIALRLSDNDVSEATLGYAFAECRDTDVAALKSAVLKGRNDVVSYIETTGYRFLTESISKSFADFERECDNFLYSVIQSARMESFGPEPLAAYYLAKEAEYKNLALIAGARNADLPDVSVRERMREIYV